MCRGGASTFSFNTEPLLDGMLSGSDILHAPCDHRGMLICNIPCEILLYRLSDL